jgi:hypothetical protein
LQAFNDALATTKQEKLNESEKKKVNSRRIPNTAVKNNGVCIFLYIYVWVCVYIYTWIYIYTVDVYIRFKSLFNTAVTNNGVCTYLHMYILLIHIYVCIYMNLYTVFKHVVVYDVYLYVCMKKTC